MKEYRIAPLIVFVYNRYEHTRKTIECLKNNRLANETDLYIFSDGPKKNEDEEKVRLVREYIKTVTGFKNVFIKESERNNGLARSIITGVDSVINIYGKAIIVEDDLLTSECFLGFMNDALDYYETNKMIMQITGNNILKELPKNYKYSVYTFYRSWSHSWATWKDRWELIDWKVTDYNQYKKSIKRRLVFNKCGTDVDKMLKLQMQGRINSWAIRFCYTQSRLNRLTVFPVENLVNNIGFDGSGTHCGSTPRVENELSNSFKYSFTDCIDVNPVINNLMRKKFDRSILRRIRRLLAYR